MGVNRLKITNECAQVFFKNYDYTNEEIYHIESDSYVIYSFGNQIIALHKTGCIQRVILDEVPDAANYLRNRRMITDGDTAYYVYDDMIIIEDLESGNKKQVSLKKEGDEEARPCCDLWLYNEHYLIYRTAFCMYHMIDLNIGIESEQDLEIMADTCGVYLRGDYLYFLAYGLEDDDVYKEYYKLMRYGLKNHENTDVTKHFAVHNDSTGIRAMYAIAKEGVAGNVFYCIFEYQDISSDSRRGFDCFCMDMSPNSMSEVKRFHIRTPRAYQIEQYNGKLIYINGDKDYSLIVHDIVRDKASVIARGCGTKQKSIMLNRGIVGAVMDRLMIDREVPPEPESYARVGKWIRIRRRQNWALEIVEI